MAVIKISDKKILDNLQAKLILRLGRKISQQETLDLCLKHAGKDFEELVTFSKESGIERIGVFGFSEEEDTEAFKFKNVVPPELIEERKEILMDISSENIKKYNQSIRHSTQEFLPLGPWDNNTTIGRIKYQAPEVDGFTQISHQFENKYGIYEIKITDHSDEILFGEKI